VTACERFETEAILRLEQGLPLDEHFASCADCRSARAAYDRLREGLAAVGERYQPPAGWRERVWAAIEERQGRPRRRWPWIVAPVGLAAALAALLLVRVPQPGASAASLHLEVLAGHSAVRRGVEAQPGDRIILHATTGGAAQAELRVYRNDAELVLRCSTEAPCVRRGEDLRAAMTLDGIGRYQSLLFLSQKPLPSVASDLETDTSAALAAGADVELGPEVVVH